jgi:two-component system, NarL family, captular synthesis response regulator RcsB
MSLGCSVLLADDHPLMLAGVSAILAQSGVVEHLACVENASGIVAQLTHIPHDVLITDYSMPDARYGDGLQMLGFLRRRYPRLPIVVLTLIDNPALLRAMQRLGVLCIVSKKDAAALVVKALQSALRGKPYASPAVEAALRAAADRRGETGAGRLSKREVEVLRLYAEGLSVSEIATRLKRSVKTVSGQKKSAFIKLGVEHDADLFRYALDAGLINGPSPAGTHEHR